MAHTDLAYRPTKPAASTVGPNWRFHDGWEVAYCGLRRAEAGFILAILAAARSELSSMIAAAFLP